MGAVERPRRTLPRTLALVGVALAFACEGRGADEAAPKVGGRTAALPAARPDATPSDPAPCRDHSGLDPASLPALPPTPYTATFDEVWRIVLTKHFDPTLACLDWPALREEYGRRLVDVREPAEAYAVMNQLLGRLGQSHFRVVPPDDVLHDDRPQGPARAPLQVRWIDDAAVVVDPAVGGVESGVPRGSIVVAIDGRAVAEIADHARAESQRPSELAFAISTAIARRLSGDEGARHRLTLRVHPNDDAEVEREVPCTSPVGEVVSLGNLHNLPTTVEWRMIPGTKIGYLAFNYWMLPMMKRVEAAMTELRAQGMTALILDLRGNPGGVGAMSVPLARLLLREGGTLGTLRFRDFVQEFKVAPNPSAFDGEVVVLVDEGTASTSEIFATGMRDLGRVKIVGGRPSAGAALPSLIERLAGGATLQYVVGDYHSSKGTVAEGDGVVPDVVVPEARDDFIAGRDPVLDAAVAALSERSP
ncbi:MAG: S41 family peptidase [Nannocystaceae bacterium]